MPVVLQRGKRGGVFYISKGGKKIYGKPPTERPKPKPISVFAREHTQRADVTSVGGKPKGTVNEGLRKWQEAQRAKKIAAQQQQGQVKPPVLPPVVAHPPKPPGQINEGLRKWQEARRAAKAALATKPPEPPKPKFDETHGARDEQGRYLTAPNSVRELHDRVAQIAKETYPEANFKPPLGYELNSKACDKDGAGGIATWEGQIQLSTRTTDGLTEITQTGIGTVQSAWAVGTVLHESVHIGRHNAETTAQHIRSKWYYGEEQGRVFEEGLTEALTLHGVNRVYDSVLGAGSQVSQTVRRRYENTDTCAYVKEVDVVCTMANWTTKAGRAAEEKAHARAAVMAPREEMTRHALETPEVVANMRSLQFSGSIETVPRRAAEMIVDTHLPNVSGMARTYAVEELKLTLEHYANLKIGTRMSRFVRTDEMSRRIRHIVENPPKSYAESDGRAAKLRKELVALGT